MSNPKLRLLPSPPTATSPSPEVGDCWHDDDWSGDFYATRHAGKRALVVVLPHVGEFCVYSCVISGGERKPERGWDVTGEAPRITLSPSLNFEGRWHGWIRDGEIITC